jgi:hypothetical protein
VAVAIWAMSFNRQTSMSVLQSNILKDLKQEFRRMSGIRTAVAEYGLRKLENGPDANWEDVPAGVGQLMDFFDQLAMYLKHRSLNEEMVFISFFYWLHPYWTFFQDDVERMKIANPLGMYDEIPIQIKRLIPVGRRLKARMDDLDTSSLALAKFFRAEIMECGSGASHSVAERVNA